MYLADHENIFTRGTHHEWGFVGGPMAPHQIQDGSKNVKNVNNSVLDKYMHQILREDAPRHARGDDHVSDQKSKSEVNSCDVIKWTSGA